jgi:hypothetical protein
MFCGRLAACVVIGTIDPLDNGWLYEFLTRAAHRERMHWATNVTQQLREANEQAKESAWERWIERYLQRRVVLNPLPLDAQESGAMCEWALVLNAHYSEIVGLLLSVAAKNGAILAGLWPCFRLQQPLPAFPRVASRTIRFCTSLLRSSRTVKPPAR